MHVIVIIIQSGVVFEKSSEIILELKFGEGGKDSKIFVDELFSAYVRYASSKKLYIELLLEEEGHILAKIIGNQAFQIFRDEIGQHVCQRVPPTEHKGRKQTSVISVGILPIKKEIYAPLKEEDLEIITQNGHGKGGQHQNKTQSAVRIKHKPTGLSVFINGRSQNTNMKEARDIIRCRVGDYYKTLNDESYAKFRKEVLSNGNRGSKIRTYNFLESRVTDHRTGRKTHNVKEVMKGNFDLLKK